MFFNLFKKRRSLRIRDRYSINTIREMRIVKETPACYLLWGQMFTKPGGSDAQYVEFWLQKTSVDILDVDGVPRLVVSNYHINGRVVPISNEPFSDAM